MNIRILKITNLILVLILLPFILFADDRRESFNHWELLSEQIYRGTIKEELHPIAGGASNTNYRFKFEGKDYFVRFAPNASDLLGADLEVEYQVLEALSRLEVSPRPYHFNKERKILIIDYLEKDESPISLLHPKTRKEVAVLLKQIETHNLKIEREFKPLEAVRNYLIFADSLGAFPEKMALPKEFESELLPALAHIEPILSSKCKKGLCHLDLHAGNILRSQGKLYLIDWEYAVMFDPLFTLGSMASIERWSDAQMEALLLDYSPEATLEEGYRLYLNRIVADIYWVMWNHIQNRISPLNQPYETWETLFFEAALERVRSSKYQEACDHLCK